MQLWCTPTIRISEPWCNTVNMKPPRRNGKSAFDLSHYDLDIWSLTLITFSAVATHMVIICHAKNFLDLAVTLIVWPLTLKTFSATTTHVTITCAKCHWNPSTKWRDIASREIGVNGRTDNARTDNRRADPET